MMKIKLISVRCIVLFAGLILFAGCGGKDDGGVEASLAMLQAETVNCNATTNKIITQGNKNIEFVAEIVTPTGVEPWCSFDINNMTISTAKGQVGQPLYLYMLQNTEKADRTVQIVVTYADQYTVTLTLTQTEFSLTADYDRAWAEQPEYRPNANYIYKTYFTTLSKGQYVRNYSICYDTSKRVAHWVAYPMHITYTTPNVGRSDAWAYDPNTQQPTIPDNYQQYIVDTYGTGYARGHQCASADRYSTVATNEMTFYATNMMPQNGTFNGGIWGKLEGNIRSNMTSMRKDTLYVVTGTYFGNSTTMTDRRGNRIAVPSNCWKVLLRTKSGNTGKAIEQCTADELMGIGFWFANSSSNPSSLSSCAMSIAEIEAKTGFEFFRNLPDDAEAAVKSQNNFAAWNMN